MTKSWKIIFTLISFLLVLQFILLIMFLFTRVTDTSLNGANPTISSERAKEVALDYISHGTAGDVTFVSESDARIYAVDISYENLHYVIYVDGETGDVVWLTREKIGD